MNTRERFLAIMNFEPVDRTLKWEFGYWAETIRRWYSEGLTLKTGISECLLSGDEVMGESLAQIEGKDTVDKDLHKYFGQDSNLFQVPVSIYPPCKKVICEENDHYVIAINEYGVKMRERKDKQSMPYFLEFPIKSRVDFEEMKDQWKEVPLEKRLPENWAMLVKKYKNRTFPLVIGGYPIGLYGTLRYLIGPEQVLYAFYDDPKLIRDMVNFLADHIIHVWSGILNQLSVDYAQIWEDMCYRGGPLISPAMFREFLLPAYKKVSSFCNDMGINILFVDSDGDITELIPLWLEGGVTGLYPFEVQAGMDVVKVRREFPKLQIMGGIDKMAIAQGRKAIVQELKKVSSLLPTGGYIPHLDHLVPPDVSWKNFEYYRRRLNELIDNVEKL